MLLADFKRYWEELKRGRPGHRFQDRYEHAARKRGEGRLLQRVLKIVLGLAAIAFGIAEIVFPGPAIFFFFVGGGLLATESRLVARAMDWAELRGREFWRHGRTRWQAASTAARVVLVAIVTCGGLASGYVAYRVIAS